MDLRKLNQWLILATNIGVLAGIVLLAIELNQNTLMLRNETDVAIYGLATERSLLLAESAEFADIFVRADQGFWNEFTDVEKIRLIAWFGSTLDGAELQYRLYQRTGETLDNIVFPDRILGWPSFGHFWGARKSAYQPGFVEFIDARRTN